MFGLEHVTRAFCVVATLFSLRHISVVTQTLVQEAGVRIDWVLRLDLTRNFSARCQHGIRRYVALPNIRASNEQLIGGWR